MPLRSKKNRNPQIGQIGKKSLVLITHHGSAPRRNPLLQEGKSRDTVRILEFTDAYLMTKAEEL